MTKPANLFSSRAAAIAAGLTLTATLLAGCVAAPPPRVVREPVYVEEPGEVVAIRPPPPPRYEAVPPPPNERVVWVAGHWHWDGHDFSWNPGHYVERPTHEARWEPGRWTERDGRWVWSPGRWEGR